jgi:hypothetical protein
MTDHFDPKEERTAVSRNPNRTFWKARGSEAT